MICVELNPKFKVIKRGSSFKSNVSVFKTGEKIVNPYGKLSHF